MAEHTVRFDTIPLSRIVAAEDFDARRDIADAGLQHLSACMRERGCPQPIRVAAHGDGQFRLIDGNRRYRAAVLAAMVELPAIVVAGPVMSVCADGTVSLPSNVFEPCAGYPIDRFSMTPEADKQVGELCALLSLPREHLLVHLGPAARERARALGAAYRSSDGSRHLIVGQDLADRLAADFVAASLRTQRELAALES